MKKNAKKVAYSEPAEYIPKSIRKELGIGEFAKKTETKKTETKKKVKRSK